MSRRIVFTPEADAHLLDLYRYIARAASPEIAEGFTSAVITYCEGFTTFPERGTRRDDLRPGLRLVGFRGKITIAFRVEPEAVNILGIYYGGRDFPSLLEKP